MNPSKIGFRVGCVRGYLDQPRLNARVPQVGFGNQDGRLQRRRPVAERWRPVHQGGSNSQTTSTAGIDDTSSWQIERQLASVFTLDERRKVAPTGLAHIDQRSPLECQALQASRQ